LIKEGHLEFGEALEKAKGKLKRWHFEQIKNYVNVFNVAYQQTSYTNRKNKC